MITNLCHSIASYLRGLKNKNQWYRIFLFKKKPYLKECLRSSKKCGCTQVTIQFRWWWEWKKMIIINEGHDYEDNRDDNLKKI